MNEQERIFINNFSNLDIDSSILPTRVELPIYDKFLTNEIGIKYIGHMLKDIDIRLYLEYLKMLKDKIKFSSNYSVEHSVCISEIFDGVTRDVTINIPNIKNGMDMLATSHELGHGLKSFTKINNERHIHSNTMYDETISILFGRVCLERYISDFSYDEYTEQFEILNITNAIKCLNKIKIILPNYITKQEEFDNTTAKIVKNPRRDDYKYHASAQKIENLRDEIYTLISYPIGISLANVYDNFDDKQKEEYLNFISKYLLNIKQIEFKMILDYFNIPFDADFYIKNFKEYIDKFNNKNNKKLVLGGRK